MKGKVLITGASGFVGFHLVEAAIASGLEVYASVRKSSIVDHLSSHNIQYTHLDFTNVESMSREISEKGYNYIIHAAGITKARNQEEYNRVNADLTENLAKAAVLSGTGVKKMVFISSLAAIGPSSEPGHLISDGDQPHPVTSYGKSKLLAEQKLDEIKLPVVVLRPTAVYGSRDKDIFIVLKTFSRGFEPYIGTKPQQLSFVYVKDLARTAVQSLFTGDSANGKYNITDGQCYDRYEMARITKEVLQKRTLKVHLPLTLVRALAILLEKGYAGLGKTPALNLEKLNELTAVNWCCDITKAKQHLGHNPAYDLQAGLTEALKWYKEHKWL